MSDIRAENEKLLALLRRVLEANIARGCKPGHPRLRLVYDIQDAVYSPVKSGPQPRDDRYRYREIRTPGYLLRLCDDGCRIEFQIREPAINNVSPEEWIFWAEYKQCDVVGPGLDLADYLMNEIAKHRERIPATAERLRREGRI